jgi:putative ABC transport system ATP-binding protein
LKNISLSVPNGSFVAIMGPSGSGKSTLMNIIGLLDVPTSGKYILDGTPLENLSGDEQSRFRGQKV